MPKHITRLLLLLVVALLGAYAAKRALTDPSFYRYGHYRADSVAEIAAQQPRIMGSAACRECHEERNDDWLKSLHVKVQCEVCHGVDPEHPDDGRTLVPADVIRLCTQCHLEMPARPEAQPQIVLGEHPYPGEPTPPCTECHDPHSPGSFEPEAGAEEAAADSGIPAPPLAAKCAKCHGKQGEGRKKNPPLAGLPAAEFTARLAEFANGERKNKIMTKFATSLTAEEIAELASYYESLPAAAAANAEQ